MGTLEDCLRVEVNNRRVGGRGERKKEEGGRRGGRRSSEKCDAEERVAAGARAH